MLVMITVREATIKRVIAQFPLISPNRNVVKMEADKYFGTPKVQERNVI
jgi:hypothetical protein